MFPFVKYTGIDLNKISQLWYVVADVFVLILKRL